MKTEKNDGGVAYAVVFALVLVVGVASCWNKYVNGNKTAVDFNQNFKVAYLEQNGKTERIEIKAWKDWSDSDAIQFIGVDGKVYYTHLTRVILSDR